MNFKSCIGSRNGKEVANVFPGQEKPSNAYLLQFCDVSDHSAEAQLDLANLDLDKKLILQKVAYI